MYSSKPYGLAEHRRHIGTGTNLLRVEQGAQPWALRPGDWLLTGDRVLAEPTEAGNGGVNIWLTGGHDGHEIRVPAWLALALAPPSSQPLPENQDRCRESGHNPFRNSGMCARCGADI